MSQVVRLERYGLAGATFAETVRAALLIVTCRNLLRGKGLRIGVPGLRNEARDYTMEENPVVESAFDQVYEMCHGLRCSFGIQGNLDVATILNGHRSVNCALRKSRGRRLRP